MLIWMLIRHSASLAPEAAATFQYQRSLFSSAKKILIVIVIVVVVVPQMLRFYQNLSLARTQRHSAS